jgi:hypothetical protein
MQFSKPVKKKKKKQDNKDLYLAVHERDKGCCRLCGDPVPIGSVHHIYDKSHNTIDDLITLGWANMCRCQGHFIYHHVGIASFICLYCEYRNISKNSFDKYPRDISLKITAQKFMKGMIK